MVTNASITKLNNITQALHQQALKLDYDFSKDKAYSWRKERELFAHGIFSTHSEKLAHYVEEIQSEIAKLSQLIATQKHNFAEHQLQRIEQQISAVINTLEAKSYLNKTEKIQHGLVKARNYQKATKQLFQPIQALYQKLSETMEFERRLLIMLTEKEQQLKCATPSKQAEASQAVLIVHQRLGRCRQAISKLERQIEMQEKR